MKKLGTLLIILICSHNSFSQQNATLAKLSAEFCDCVNNSNAVGDKIIRECTASFMRGPSFQEYVSDSIITPGDTAKLNGYEAGQKLWLKIQSKLVYECDRFFIIADSLKYSGWAKRDTAEARKKLTDVDKRLQTDSSGAAYLTKAALHLQLLELDESAEAIKQFVQKSPSHPGGFLYSGMIHELKGDYARAVSDYKKVKDLTGKQEVELFIAIAERKLAKK